jgi:hypothetical protein
MGAFISEGEVMSGNANPSPPGLAFVAVFWHPSLHLQIHE